MTGQGGEAMASRLHLAAEITEAHTAAAADWPVLANRAD